MVRPGSAAASGGDAGAHGPGRRGEVAALVGNFPRGPLLEPRTIDSLDALVATFGLGAVETPTGHALELFLAAGGPEALVMRCGGPGPMRASDLVIGISALAISELEWDFVCFASLGELDDREFDIVVEHARSVCRQVRRDVRILDPRAREAAHLPRF